MFFHLKSLNFFWSAFYSNLPEIRGDQWHRRKTMCGVDLDPRKIQNFSFARVDDVRGALRSSTRTLHCMVR